MLKHHDHGRMILVQLLPSSSTSWIRHFTMIIPVWWLQTSIKLCGKKSKNQLKNSEIGNSEAS